MPRAAKRIKKRRRADRLPQTLEELWQWQDENPGRALTETGLTLDELDALYRTTDVGARYSEQDDPRNDDS